MESEGKIRLQIQRKGEFFLDILNLFSASQRTTFARRAARLLVLAPRLIEADLYQIVSLLESGQAQPGLPLLSTTEMRSAEELLSQADLLTRLLVALSGCGLDQSDAVNLLAFLLLLTRHTAHPQCLILHGNTTPKRIAFLGALLAVMPQEELLAPAFFSKPHPLLALPAGDKLILLSPEISGKTLKRQLLQLRLAAALPRLHMQENGQDRAVHLSTRMPSVVTSTASAIGLIGEELLLLALPENRSPAEGQKGWQRHTREAAQLQERRMATTKLVQNAQRLLQPRQVHNPQAEMLHLPLSIPQRSFLQDLYLSLIDAVTLLHQRLRPTSAGEESLLPIVESSSLDLAVVDQLFLLAVLPNFLPEKSRTLLEWLTQRTPNQPVEAADWSIQRLREELGWSETSLRKHLERLKNFAFLRPVSNPGSRPALFRLNATPQTLSALLTKAGDDASYTSFLGQPTPTIHFRHGESTQ
jgi:hypothetical protein